jgi:hypothetical protein
LSVRRLFSTRGSLSAVSVVGSSTRYSSIAGAASIPLWPVSSFLRVGALSVGCSVSAAIFSGAAMSVALSIVVVVFEIGPLAATSAHDAGVAGLLSARSRRLCGHAVFR